MAMHNRFIAFTLCTLLLFAHFTPLVYGDNTDDYSCTKAKKCKVGCCGKLDKSGKGVCGLGPKFCGDGCTSTCDQKSECDPGWGNKWASAKECPLKVCCSEFGFCGTTKEFCGDKKVVAPQCNGGHSIKERTIGYYEGWNHQHKCGTMTPKEIPLGYYSHINFAFALIDPKTFKVAPMDPDTASLYKEVTGLKANQPELKVWIAIGGWAMNDEGPTRTTFSDLVHDKKNQEAFCESLIGFLIGNDFDGVDIDWEYPVTDDRGGKKEDFENYVNFLKLLRERLNGSGHRFGVSITLPASYWYLKGFDITHLEPYVDWFNIMTYDIHGVWDSKIKSLGANAYAHTNLTEIDQSLELLWRNNINPAKVTLGLGFYGRSFTMKDPKCMKAGCPFKEGAKGGECTGTPGVLSAAEINKIIKAGAKVDFDEKAAVQIVTWDKDQWVSWDDKKTLKLKVDYANGKCLGGTMVWAIDLDDGTLIEALGESMGKKKKKSYPDVPYLKTDLGTHEL